METEEKGGRVGELGGMEGEETELYERRIFKK